MALEKIDITRNLEIFRIKNYIVNDDLTVDVDGDVNFNNEHMDKLPINFNKISGSLKIANCNLKSLKGCPVEIGKNFMVAINNLQSLEYAPKKVGGDFHCECNDLTSLKFAPEIVGGNFICAFNQLTTLDFLPINIGGDIICRNNPFENPIFNTMVSDDIKIYIENRSLNSKLITTIPINNEDDISPTKLKL